MHVTKRALTRSLGLIFLALGTIAAIVASTSADSARAGPPEFPILTPFDLPPANSARASPPAQRPTPPSHPQPPPEAQKPTRTITDSARSPGVLNINTATRQELEILPGIGPSKAASIIAWRERLRGFKQLRDLRRVKGIGRKTVERLTPFLTLDGPTTLTHPP